MSDPYGPIWRARVRRLAADEDSDVCTAVADLYADCCFEHDHAYRTGTDIWRRPITRAAADAAYWQCMTAHSYLGRGDPVAWVRWLGVRLFGRRAWRRKDNAPRR